MSKKKNGFREWLSDNLRYVILGFEMLVILALLYIGFYYLVALVAGTQLKEPQAIESVQDSDASDEDGEDIFQEEGTTGEDTPESNTSVNNTQEE